MIINDRLNVIFLATLSVRNAQRAGSGTAYSLCNRSSASDSV